MNFEEELRGALRREAAPADFSAQVMARVRRPSRRVPYLLAAAAAVAAIALPAVHEYRVREEARGLEAKRQLLIALQVTRTQLLHTKEKLRRTGRHEL